MSKHPLLPGAYSEGSLQVALIHALGPYAISDRMDVSNPSVKWDLNKAWEEAEPLLKRGGWRRVRGGDEDDITASYELLADAESEIDQLNIIIAGLVARQILDPESGLGVRRIEHRKGGEMAVTISATVAETLKRMFPQAEFLAEERKSE